MTITNDRLATGPVLARAADIIHDEGHVKQDFVTGDGYCAAGAIGKACGIDPEDWYDEATCKPRPREYTIDGHFDAEGYDRAYQAWKAGRAAALAALRTLAARIDPECTPAAMSRRELLAIVGDWNDLDASAGDDKTTTAEQVVAELRAAAREAVSA
jgi:hypothetical protein